MFRRKVSPPIVAAAVVLILAAVQVTYWRLLVYHPPAAGSGPIALTPGPPPPGPGAYGLQEVRVDTLAGGAPGYLDGPGWQARLCGPNALALDRDGSLLVADCRNHRIRRVTPMGAVTTVAGGGSADGPGGCSEGPALEARLRYPSGVAVGPDGAVYFSDTGNHRLCRLFAGTVKALAGGPEQPTALPAPGALAFVDGALWALDASDLRIRRVDLSGAVTTPAAVPAAVHAQLGDPKPLSKPVSLLAWELEVGGDPLETTYTVRQHSASWAPGSMPRVFADTHSRSVLVQGTEGPPVLLAGSLPFETPAAEGTGNRASFAAPCAVVTTPDGVAFIADYEANCIRRLRLPQWLVEGSWYAPGRRRRWRDERGD